MEIIFKRDEFRKQNIEHIINDTNQEWTVILQLSVTLHVKMEDPARVQIIASVQIITRVPPALNVGSPRIFITQYLIMYNQMNF